jgi:hypothetical protein
MALPLHDGNREVPVSVAARVGLVLTVPALVTCASIGARAHARSAVSVAAALAPESDDDAPDMNRPEENGKGASDLYGNQVTDAVATYKLDATGTLYELHSPQTELPRLPSPKS